MLIKYICLKQLHCQIALQTNWSSSFLWVNKQYKQYVYFPIRKTRDDLNCYQEQCDAILKDVSTALEHLDSLQKQYLFVSNKTGTLHDSCERLLKEQVSCVVLSIYQPKLRYKQITEF